MTDQTPETHNPDLAALAAEAALADAGAAPAVVQPDGTVPGAPEAVPVDRTAEVKMLLAIGRPLITMAVPYIKDAPDSEWDALIEPIGDLLNHYQVDVGEWIKNPWLRLGVSASPLIMRGVMAWQADAEKKTDKAPELTAADPASSDPGVTAPTTARA